MAAGPTLPPTTAWALSGPLRAPEACLAAFRRRHQTKPAAAAAMATMPPIAPPTAAPTELPPPAGGSGAGAGAGGVAKPAARREELQRHGLKPWLGALQGGRGHTGRTSPASKQAPAVPDLLPAR